VVPADHVLTRDEARQRASLLSDVAYEVDLDLTRPDDTFRSTVRVTFAAEPGAATFIDLLATRVHRAELNGAALPEDAIGEGCIALKGLQATNELVIAADCAYERTGVGLHRFQDPVDNATYLHTQFEPFDAHRVYACFDQPDLKAPFTLTATAPAEWELISNTAGHRRDGADAGPQSSEPTARWSFPATPPISPYLTALVAGPFKSVADHHRGVELRWWARTSLFEHVQRQAEELFALTRQGLDFFANRFGVAYPFGRYNQLLVPEFNFGAMENPGCVTYNEAFVFRSAVTDAQRQSRASTILHEMAHMWFGNLVTMRWWDDLWLNESFATYMGTRAVAEATRFTDAWAAFAAQVKAWAIDQDQLPSTHPITADLADTDALRTHFDGITYAKGASVLKALVAWVGDDAFSAGIRDYFERHAWDNADLTDFLDALAKASGRDLDAWSREWLQTSGVETLEVAAAHRGNELTELTVRPHPPEVGDAVTRRHRLAIGCYRDDGNGRLVRQEATTVDVEGGATDSGLAPLSPAPELVLPNDDDAAFAKLRLDDRSVATLRQRLGDLADPLASAVAWGALWDMVRDAELAASAFVELSADHADATADLTSLQLHQRRAVAAADRYGDPDKREANHARLLASAHQALARCEPGSGRQLAWVTHLTACGGRDAEHRAWLLGLLHGRDVPDGLTVDTDLRWRLIVRLAADGVIDEERIAAEVERDPTDMGLRHAATARAARPGAGSKQHAWDALLGDRELPLATQRAMCAGFWRYGQEDVLAGFAERYPEAIEAAWDGRVQEESIELTRGLYPSTVITPRVVEIADELLAGDLPGPARRVISEERDQTQRALRARAADATTG
jgi:aminopeptidase N